MVRYAVVSIFGTLAFADAIENVTRWKNRFRQWSRPYPKPTVRPSPAFFDLRPSRRFWLTVPLALL